MCSRIALVQLGDCRALPVAEGDFGKPRIAGVSVGRKTERAAHELHGLGRALERARGVVEAGRIAALAREQIAQDAAAMNGLRAPARVERNVAAALQAALDVPIGFAVADVVDGRRSHFPLVPAKAGTQFLLIYHRCSGFPLTRE